MRPFVRISGDPRGDLIYYPDSIDYIVEVNGHPEIHFRNGHTVTLKGQTMQQTVELLEKV
jgi:hypothetical protein